MQYAPAIPAARSGVRTHALSRVLTILALAACMAIPVALSYYFFMGQSLRLDEAQSLWQTSRSYGDIFSTVAGDVHVPLYHLILRTWRLYVGDGVVLARALSLLFYVISIPALYLLGKTAYGRRIGLFASFLFSISPFMNWYGNEIRMYTLFTLFVILNQYFYIRLFTGRHNDTMWVGYILTALIGAFTHYFFFLNLLAQAIFYFLRRDLFPAGSLKRFVLAAAIILVLFAPWAWFVLHLGTVGFQEPLLARPSSVDLFSSFAQFLFGFQVNNINTALLSLWPIAVILGLLSLRRARMKAETHYFLTSIIVSFGVAFFGSFLIAPIFVSRYLIFTIPSFYLLIASLFEKYPATLRTFANWSLVALMVAMLGVEIVSPTTPVKENYVQAVDYLNTHASAQDTIILSAPFTIYPVQYFYNGTAPIVTLPIWNQYAHGPIPAFDPSTLPQQVDQAVGASQDIYLLLSYDQGYEQNIKQYFDSHYQLVYRQNFSQDLNLYVYRARYNTTFSDMAGSGQ